MVELAQCRTAMSQDWVWVCGCAGSHRLAESSTDTFTVTWHGLLGGYCSCCATPKVGPGAKFCASCGTSQVSLNDLRRLSVELCLSTSASLGPSVHRLDVFVIWAHFL